LRYEASRLINIIATETWRACEAIRAIYSLIAAVAAVAIFGLFLLSLSWQMTLAVGVGVLLIRLFQRQLGRRLGPLSNASVEANMKLTERMLAAVGSIRVIRIFRQETSEQARFNVASNRVRRAIFAVEVGSSTLGPTLEALHAALFVGILFGAVALGADLPVIATFLALLYRIQPHLRLA
jgi:ABC-type multidrug transport system fused ATPase/permease subunit